MVLKLLLIFSILHISLGQRYSCSEKSALHLFKRPVYDFSMDILDRVAQSTDAHFVFSPLSTWLQLSALAEGARGTTLTELRNITRHPRNKCFKAKFKRILRKQNKNLSEEYRRKSVIVIDEFMRVNRYFMKNVLQYYGVKVLLKNFDKPETAAREVNKFISRGTDGFIDQSVYVDDFNSSYSSMVLSDNVVFRSAWKYPFDPARTQVENFTSVASFLGEVNMMSYTGYLNVTDMRIINARVLEIPCVGNFSMLIFTPIESIVSVYDVFYNLNRTNLASVFNVFKRQGEQLVNVKLPRFKINSTIDNLAELLYDMNVKTIFDPNSSDLSHISDFMLYTSLVTQEAYIEVTEQGVRAGTSPAQLINDTKESIDFFANKPFGYMIIERKTQFILFAGIYSEPEKY